MSMQTIIYKGIDHVHSWAIAMTAVDGLNIHFLVRCPYVRWLTMVYSTSQSNFCRVGFTPSFFFGYVPTVPKPCWFYVPTHGALHQSQAGMQHQHTCRGGQKLGLRVLWILWSFLKVNTSGKKKHHFFSRRNGDFTYFTCKSHGEKSHEKSPFQVVIDLWDDMTGAELGWWSTMGPWQSSLLTTNLYGPWDMWTSRVH